MRGRAFRVGRLATAIRHRPTDRAAGGGRGGCGPGRTDAGTAATRGDASRRAGRPASPVGAAVDAVGPACKGGSPTGCSRRAAALPGRGGPGEALGWRVAATAPGQIARTAARPPPPAHVKHSPVPRRPWLPRIHSAASESQASPLLPSLSSSPPCRPHPSIRRAAVTRFDSPLAVRAYVRGR